MQKSSTKTSNDHVAPSVSLDSQLTLAFYEKPFDLARANKIIFANQNSISSNSSQKSVVTKSSRNTTSTTIDNSTTTTTQSAHSQSSINGQPYPRIGDQIKIFWEGDNTWYPATVFELSIAAKQIRVYYHDGLWETENLDKIKFEYIPKEIPVKDVIFEDKEKNASYTILAGSEHVICAYPSLKLVQSSSSSNIQPSSSSSNFQAPDNTVTRRLFEEGEIDYILSMINLKKLAEFKDYFKKGKGKNLDVNNLKQKCNDGSILELAPEKNILYYAVSQKKGCMVQAVVNYTNIDASKANVGGISALMLLLQTKKIPHTITDCLLDNFKKQKASISEVEMKMAQERLQACKAKPFSLLNSNNLVILSRIIKINNVETYKESDGVSAPTVTSDSKNIVQSNALLFSSSSNVKRLKVEEEVELNSIDTLQTLKMREEELIKQLQTLQQQRKIKEQQELLEKIKDANSKLSQFSSLKQYIKDLHVLNTKIDASFTDSTKLNRTTSSETSNAIQSAISDYSQNLLNVVNECKGLIGELHADYTNISNNVEKQNTSSESKDNKVQTIKFTLNPI